MKAKGEHMTKGISRRSFLNGAALVGAAAALGSAGLTLSGCSSNSNAEAEEQHNPVSTEQADVVVVGSGTAGICATVRAAQLGAHVILLEKNGATGGSSAFAEGVGAVNSYMHDAQNEHFDCAEVLSATESYHHWAADANILDHYIRESGNTINWLHDQCGINFYETSITSPTSYPSWHLAADADGNLTRIGKGLIEPMTDLAQRLGADIRTLCPATGLMTDGDRVTGVYYQNDNSWQREEHAIEAPVVFLATGGYACNDDLFNEFTQLDRSRFYNFGAFGATGDGIQWGRQLGAETHNIGTVMYACTHVPNTQMFEDPVNWIFSWQPNLRVNQDGKRFMNEQMATDFSIVSNSIIGQQKAYSVLDHGYVQYMQDVALPMGLDSVGYHTGQPLPGALDALEKAVADGKVFKGDTIEELAQNMGVDVDSFADTVREYNGYAAAGADPKFGCPASGLHALSDGPFYAAEIMPAIFTTVGGLKVDENWRVIRTDGTPIEGLFALGNDASSQVGHDYDVGVMSGSQQGWCATGGRLSVEYALKELGITA